MNRKARPQNVNACLAGLMILLLGTLALPALAHDDATAAKAEKPSPEMANKGYFGAFDFDYELAVRKLYGLAKAVPAEKYGWRPGEGVRSVSESLMHVAEANYNLAGFLGVEKPADLPAELEKVTDKDEVLKLLKSSIAQVRKAVAMHKDTDLDGTIIEFFDNKVPARQMFFILLGHTHEHLGQMIAYARSNEVAPPWQHPLALDLEKP